jgi:hypothetical protein
MTRTSQDRTQAAQIYRSVIQYHRNQIRWFCELARRTPNLRDHMLSCARHQAAEIRTALRAWRA